MAKIHFPFAPFGIEGPRMLANVDYQLGRDRRLAPALRRAGMRSTELRAPPLALIPLEFVQRPHNDIGEAERRIPQAGSEF